MKRTLLTGMAVALVLGGCATGETGHLDPEITPDLAAPLAAGGSGVAGQEAELDDEPDQDRQEAGADDVNIEIVNVFQDAAARETWYADVVSVDADEALVVVTTRLVAGDVLAVRVCETAYEAAEDAGVATPSVEVRDAEGAVLSGRDGAADEEACSAA